MENEKGTERVTVAIEEPSADYIAGLKAGYSIGMAEEDSRRPRLDFGVIALSAVASYVLIVLIVRSIRESK